MRIVALLLVSCACASLCGCETMNQRISRSERIEANNPHDYHDEFEDVGKEGRGHSAMEHESDGFSRWIESPKARAINRNLGID